MNKIAFDQGSDYSQVELYRYLKNIELPENVKTAEADNAATLEALPKTAFADDLHRAYPLNTPARAFISHVYFTQKKADLDKEFGPRYTAKIAERLTNALQLFGLDKEAEAYTKTAEAQEAIDFAEHSVCVTLEDGDTIELYNIKTAADLEAAAQDFTKHLKTIPMEWRFKVAEDLVKVAKAVGVDELPDLLCKYAGLFYPDFAHIQQEVLRRRSKFASADSQQVITKLAEDTANISTREEVQKLAETIYLLEKMEGLHYTKKAALLPDVIDSFYTISGEKVAEILDVVSMGGEVFSMNELKKVSEDIYEQAFGFKVDFKADDARDVLETVPRADVALFKELSGIQGL